MSTWKRGRALLAEQLRDAALPLDLFLPEIERRPVHRVPGTAVFMTSNPGTVPPVLLHHLKHNKVLHERVLLVSIVTEDIPTVPPPSRATVRALSGGFVQVMARYGFMETPNILEIMKALRMQNIPLEMMTTTFFLGRETLLTSGKSPMMKWRKKLFAFLSKNAWNATTFYNIPPGRVIELGTQVTL
jgi:KUP system potassium uptake protein